eukprot:scaffold17121_cov122-Isochrysis_galbana.AAC.2
MCEYRLLHRHPPPTTSTTILLELADVWPPPYTDGTDTHRLRLRTKGLGQEFKSDAAFAHRARRCMRSAASQPYVLHTLYNIPRASYVRRAAEHAQGASAICKLCTPARACQE